MKKAPLEGVLLYTPYFHCFIVSFFGGRFDNLLFLPSISPGALLRGPCARSDVTLHLERITQAVLGQELLRRSSLVEELSPILQGYWPDERVQRFCDICWEAASKAAAKMNGPMSQMPAVQLDPEKEELMQKAREKLAEHYASELLEEEERKRSECLEAVPQPQPPKAHEEGAPSEASSESSAGDLKVRDEGNRFSAFQEVTEQDEPVGTAHESPAVRRARNRCKWTVKSYKDGLETTWDVLETDGHLNSMRIVGKEPVAECSRSSPKLAPKVGSDKDGRAKSGLSTLSYSETAEEEHSISMMRTVSSGTAQTVQRLVEELEEERRWEMNLEGLEEAPCEMSLSPEIEVNVPPFGLGWDPLSTDLSPSLPSLPPPQPSQPRFQSRHGSIGRTPSAPSRLEQRPPTPSHFPEHWPRPRFNSQDCSFLARQLSLDSSDRCSVTTPPGLFPSTPECEPSPSGGFMLPPLHALPSSYAEQRQVIYVPVFVPHRCRNCGHQCQPDEMDEMPGALAAPCLQIDCASLQLPLGLIVQGCGLSKGNPYALAKISLEYRGHKGKKEETQHTSNSQLLAPRYRRRHSVVGKTTCRRHERRCAKTVVQMCAPVWRESNPE